jgi:RNA ligase
MQDPRSYFAAHHLFDWDTLKQHCEHHGVWISTSNKYQDLALLKYKDDVQWGDIPWTTFNRFSRGLVVDMKNRAILAHGFDKFFNMGQMPETQYEVLKDQKEFEISEKLDGSCLVSFINPHDKGIYLTTTGSFDSEHGQIGTGLFRNLTNYQMACDYAEAGTLVFELIDPRFRIVIDYSKKNYPEGLYLIGYRTREGKLLTYEQVAILATQLDIPCMKTYKFDSLNALMENVKGLTVLDEGFVLRYPDGLMVKIKGMAYLKAHRFISQLSDKHILEAVAEGNEVADNLAALAPEEYRQDVVEKIAYFKSRKLDLLNQCYRYFAEAPKDDRKTFALWVNQNVKPSLKGCLFQLMDCKPLSDQLLYGIILKHESISTETRI